MYQNEKEKFQIPDFHLYATLFILYSTVSP